MEDFDRVLQINLRGPYSAFGPPYLYFGRQEAGRGRFSPERPIMGGLVGQSGRSAYGVAKAGLVNLARTVSMEVGMDQIRINAVCPGPIAETGLSAGIAERRPAVFKHFLSLPHLRGSGQRQTQAGSDGVPFVPRRHRT